MTVDRDWLEGQVNSYSNEELPRYQLFSEVLERIMKHACLKFEIQGIIMARTKIIPSFAEKIIRKADKYGDPVHQLTDLCGIRVITNTQDETDNICQFIRKNFRVDEENSLDVRTLLKAEEFGYRSVHYVVQLQRVMPDARSIIKNMEDEKGGLDIHGEIGDLKAEIQIRTLLQHAWAMISHDRFYKSEFETPEHFRRELARVAALLEDADLAFGNAIKGIDRYRLDYGAYMTREQIVEEIDKWEMVLSYDKGNAQLAHKIAQLAIAMEAWDRAVNVLLPFRDSGKSFILRNLGIVKCRISGGGKEGRNYLEQAVTIDPKDADAWCALGDSWIEEHEENALEHYERAFQLKPSDPHILVRYLECKLRFTKNIDFIPLMYPSLEAAVKRCRELAAAKVYLPWAYYDIGKFNLLLNRPYESLTAFTKAVSLSNSTLPIEMALQSIQSFEDPILRSLPSMTELHDLDWAIEAVQRFLKVSIVGKMHHLRECAEQESRIHDQRATAKGSASGSNGLCPENGFTNEELMQNEKFKKIVQTAISAHLKDLTVHDMRSKNEPFILVAGGCTADVQEEMETYRDDLETAFECYTGTIIGGGTDAGISGIVGDLSPCTDRDFERIGYIPSNRPSQDEIHSSYNPITSKEIHRENGGPTHTSGFTPLEPIQAWIDMLASGVNPSNVRLLGINGGSISAFEYRMALALGATVGIVKSSGRSAAELQIDTDWWKPHNLILLPSDKMALRAFVNPGPSELSTKQLERVGKIIHEKFLEENRYKNIDPVMMVWEDLREDFKQSNREQVNYVEKILRSEGWEIREAQGTIRCPVFPDDEVERMAEMEHGRWIVERLRSGWRYGTDRDPKVKISPYLVPWQELPEDVRDYDRNVIREYPDCLQKAGLEVYKIE